MGKRYTLREDHHRVQPSPAFHGKPQVIVRLKRAEDQTQALPGTQKPTITKDHKKHHKLEAIEAKKALPAVAVVVGCLLLLLSVASC